MFRRQTLQSLSATHRAPPIVQLWALRLLVNHSPCGQAAKSFREEFSDRLAIGLDMIPSEPGRLTTRHRSSLGQLLLKRLSVLENERQLGRVNETYCQGMPSISQALGLCEVESAVVQFATAAYVEKPLKDAINMLGEIDQRMALHVISVALGVPLADVKSALGRQGVLARSGILTFTENEFLCGNNMFQLLNDEMPTLLLEPNVSLNDVLNTVVRTCEPPTLDLDDYPHLQPYLDHSIQYLRTSLSSRTTGVNVLLYGPPGTGKTELARRAAAELGVTLYEVSSTDSDGEPCSSSSRLRALMLSQVCLSNGPNLLLFDEVEDVFQQGSSPFEDKRHSKHKAWMNRQLETNAIPTIWVTNSVDHLDTAFARRFDVVMEVPVPPRAQREKIILAHAGRALNAPTVAVLADHTDLAPAIVARAARVAQAPARTRKAKAAVPATLLQLVNQTLKVQGLKPVGQPSPTDLTHQYSLSHLNPDVPLEGLLSSLRKRPRGRFCLYGPPGTGKSEFVRWLAQQLNTPLLLKRASDLLSAWVGGNEKNIASAFEQARRDGAILLIDEVDTFLQPRENAVRGWEASMVNEMLTQMESFQGMLFATTNLMQGMDAAAMRRFDMKINLRPPRGDQLHALLTQVSAQLGIDVLPIERCSRLSSLGITPGDVAAVTRRCEFSPVTTSEQLCQALEAEARFKPNRVAKSIGFVCSESCDT